MTEGKKLLSDAIYIINQVRMAFETSEKILLMNFERVRENDRADMVKIHLPEYLRKDSQSFIEKYTKWEKQHGTNPSNMCKRI